MNKITKLRLLSFAVASLTFPALVQALEHDSTSREQSTPVMRLASMAESVAHDGGERQSTKVPAAADASPRRSVQGNLEEVIVSAQRREERLLETPISVGVLSGQDLDRSSARGISDVLNQVGGVSLVETQPGVVGIQVRGVVSGAGTTTAGYYMDEVPFAFIRSSQLPDSNAFDLRRIEVLRGPQGTLYGANALSGVVRVLTNDANLNDFEMKGRARASSTEDGGGNYGGDLAVNVPLIEGKLAVRAVASYSDLSGFISVAPDCYVPCNPGQRRINDAQARAYRLKVGYAPTDALSFNLGVSRSDITSGAPSISRDDFTTRFGSDQSDERVLDTYNLVGEYAWTNFSLLSSTSYIDYDPRGRTAFLLGATPASVLTFNPVRSFSQELRLTSAFDGPWQWSAGAIYKDTTEKFVQDARPTLPNVYRLTEASESYAVFTELTRSFADGKVELTGGLRYFDDHLETTQYANFFPGPVAPLQIMDSEETTGRVVLTLKPRGDVMMYASVATGFRAGINQSPAVALSNPGFPSVTPDSLINYEIGAKGRLLADTLTYDTSVYYTDWDDIQQELIVPAGFRAKLNAGKASGYGADVSLSYQPITALAFQASVGWNDLKLDENVFQQGLALFTKGARLNNSPEWTGSLGASLEFAAPMAGVRTVLSSNLAYNTSRILRYLTGGVLAQTASDPIKNLHASIGFASDRWSVDVYGDNLLNEDNSVTPPDITAGNNGVRLRPRTIGVQLTVNY